ncbi:MAG: hypothetical protein IH594_04385 [Bacteroidales bacterium]|nr:hypothetical protein [Bacteroidales bacterium]
MKPLNRSLYHIILIIIIWNPAYSQTSVYDTDIQNTRKLPNLIISIDEESLERAYLSREVISAEEYQGEEVSGQFYSSVYQEDIRINDAATLFSRYLERELLSDETSPAGEIILKLTYYDYDYNNTIGSFFNVISFGLGYLAGIPGNVMKTTVELDLVILDSEMKKVAEFSGTGRKKCYEGLYFPKRDIRDLNLLALKEALLSVNTQIMNDYDSIVEDL